MNAAAVSKVKTNTGHNHHATISNAFKGDEFSAFLVQERDLARGTVWYYRSTARRFLQPLLVDDDAGLPRVSVSTVRSFVIGESACRRVGSVKNTMTALRALVRFLQVRDYLDGSLADAVPAVAGWRHRPLPGIPGDGEIAALLGSCEGGSATGRRDHAIMLLLTRLGLRTGEVGPGQPARRVRRRFYRRRQPVDPHRIRSNHDHTSPSSRVTETVSGSCSRPNPEVNGTREGSVMTEFRVQCEQLAGESDDQKNASLYPILFRATPDR